MLLNTTNTIRKSLPILANACCTKNTYLHLSQSTVNHQLNSNPQIAIFDRNAKRLQRERAANVPDPHLYEYVKEEVGYRLSDRILDVKRTFERAADVGCSRGYVSRHVTAESVKRLVLCDSNAKFLAGVSVDEGIEVDRRLISDEEEDLGLEENSYDLIVSSLSLHWINDLPKAFERIMRALRPDGVFMASVFGGDTLYELRGSLQLAELERLGGLHPHISPFADVRDVGALMNRAGFTMLTIDTDEIVVAYPSIWELMWDLKGMAENNASLNRTLHLKRDVQFAAAAIYRQLYGRQMAVGGGEERFGVPATFQMINMVGWKPDKNQPKPLERGTGQVSLKDLHRLDEIVKDIKKTDA